MEIRHAFNSQLSCPTQQSTDSTRWCRQHADGADLTGHGSRGLAKAQSTLQMIKDNLELILPIAAVIIGLIIVVLYMAEIMRKDDMVRWLIGLVIAGSIGEIVVLLWK
ncbi:MAG: hypothetical protein LRY49_03665 [Burkholderiaceae bacterium]|nr:hypothetical protein [Burkholderiaceae bacterium]